MNGEQLKRVKLALYLSTVSSSVVCCEEEQNVILDFYKGCIEQKARSLYTCLCCLMEVLVVMVYFYVLFILFEYAS